MKEGKNIIVKDSILIAILVCAGKVLGFTKQSIIAWAFGTSIETDLYFVSDGYISTIAQVLSLSIIPTVLSAYLLVQSNDKQKANELISQNFTFFSLIGGILAGISILLSNQISLVIGISYTEEQRRILSHFLIALSPVILLAAIAGVAQGYLNANHQYIPTRLNSLFFSACSILSILLFRKKLGLKSLLLGFVIGYFLYTIYAVGCIDEKISFKFKPFSKSDEFKNEISKFLPVVLGTAVVDLGHLIDKIVASSLQMGSVTILNYGQIISGDIVNAVVVSTVGTIFFTSFTENVSKGMPANTLISNIRNILTVMSFVVVAITILYFIAGEDLVRILLERGKFTRQNTILVSETASMYAIGFIFMAFREILIKIHYAYQDMVMPAVNSGMGVIINLILSVGFSKIIGVRGIALATSVSMMVVTVLSLISIKKHIQKSIFDKKLLCNIFKTIIAGILTWKIGVFMSNYYGNMASVLQLVIKGVGSIAVYSVLCSLLKESTILDLKKYILKRMDNV